MSRPATRAAVPPTAWHTISSAVTAALRRKRVNLISCARHPASRRIREQGRSTSAACKATPLFPGGDRQIAPAQIPSLPLPSLIYVFFFFNDTATTEIYTLSLHDALPISPGTDRGCGATAGRAQRGRTRRDRKSTRLNSSHSSISYAVFCLKKKKINY